MESHQEEDTFSSFDFDAWCKEAVGSKICRNDEGAVISEHEKMSFKLQKTIKEEIDKIYYLYETTPPS